VRGASTGNPNSNALQPENHSPHGVADSPRSCRTLRALGEKCGESRRPRPPSSAGAMPCRPLAGPRSRRMPWDRQPPADEPADVVAGRGPKGRQDIAPPDEGGWGTRQHLDLSPQGSARTRQEPRWGGSTGNPNTNAPQRERRLSHGIADSPRSCRTLRALGGKMRGVPPTPASFVGRGYALSAPGGASIPPDSPGIAKRSGPRSRRMPRDRQLRSRSQRQPRRSCHALGENHEGAADSHVAVAPWRAMGRDQRRRRGRE
jgi:hypothetical protein